MALSQSAVNGCARRIANLPFQAKADNGLIVTRREKIDSETAIERLAEYFGPVVEDGQVTDSTMGVSMHNRRSNLAPASYL
ncbi:MAG: hypothetical protein ACYCSS_11285 [Sulfuriferula sp.]